MTKQEFTYTNKTFTVLLGTIRKLTAENTKLRAHLATAKVINRMYRRNATRRNRAANHQD